MNYLKLNDISFIDYDELYKILNKKFKATNDEIKYWIKKSYIFNDKYYSLLPFKSDLPLNNSSIDVWELIDDDFFYPEYYYYVEKGVESFKPNNGDRFIYLKNLSARNWANYLITTKEDTIELATRKGILRCYDKEQDEFTFYKKYKIADKQTKKLWAESEEWESIITNPETFFLLEDILKVERCFFKIDREICIEQLYPPKDLNIINFQKTRKD